MTTERQSIPAGQRRGSLGNVSFKMPAAAFTAKTPSRARFYACDMEIASLQHVLTRWEDRQSTDTDVLMTGVINDPSAPAEDQGKECNLELGGEGTYDPDRGPPDLRGTARIREYLQLSVVLGIRTEEQAADLVSKAKAAQMAGQPVPPECEIDISQELETYKATKAAQGQTKISIPVRSDFEPFPVKNEDKVVTEIGITNRWTQVTTMDRYQASISEGKHEGRTREEFKASKGGSRWIQRLMDKHGLSAASPTQAGPAQPAGPAGGAYGAAPGTYGGAPMTPPPAVPGGQMANTPPPPPGTTAQMLGIPGVPGAGS